MISSYETEKKAERSAGGTIRSVEKVIDILELLCQESPGLPLSELAGRLDLNASTAHHLLATLKARGLVTQDERSKAYRIDFRLVSMINRFLSGTDLYPAGIGPVEALRDQSGETSYLTAFQGQGVTGIITLTGARPVQARRVQRQGQSSTHSTATGKIYLAYVLKGGAAEFLHGREMVAFTPHTITDPALLLAELDVVRERGYALDSEEDYLGVECIACPVFDASGVCVASVSISYPLAPAERTAELIALVTEAATRISANLGAAPLRP